LGLLFKVLKMLLKHNFINFAAVTLGSQRKSGNN